MSDTTDAPRYRRDDSGRSFSRDNRDNRDDRDSSESGGHRRKFFKRKVCKVCTGRVSVSYREPEVLRRFTTERGKILARRITGSCAKHQRLIAREIKRARILALLPFVTG